MSKHELTMRSAKRKLTWAIFKLALLILIAGTLGYLLLQQRASAINSKSDVLQRWLRGDVANLAAGDEHLRTILSRLEGKLLKIAADAKGSGSSLGVELVGVEEFNAKHQDDKHRAWQTNIANTEANLSMALRSRGIDRRYMERVKEPTGPKKDKNDEQDNKERVNFSRGLHGLYSVVTSPSQSGKGAQSVGLDQYSDLLLKNYFKDNEDDFRAYEEVKKYYPELRVSWVYIASEDSGQIALYPAINDELKLPFDDRPWYNTSLGDKRYDPAQAGHGIRSCKGNRSLGGTMSASLRCTATS